MKAIEETGQYRCHCGETMWWVNPNIPSLLKERSETKTVLQLLSCHNPRCEERGKIFQVPPKYVELIERNDLIGIA